MSEYLIGVDEVGRGPLAGPVAVGLVRVSRDLDLSLLSGLTDSKKLSEKAREEIRSRADEMMRSGHMHYTVSFVNASTIDMVGIQASIKKALARGIRKLAPTSLGSTHVLLDGGLSAPPEFSQESLIKGDVTEPVISLASVIAKTERDRRMTRYADRYSEYGFERNKGYGTREHLQALKRCGVCPIHRKSFLSSVLQHV